MTHDAAARPTSRMMLEYWLGLTPYAAGLARQEAHVARVLAGGTEGLIFCEHNHVVTVGTSGTDAEIVRADMDIVTTSRGGRTTYHGPGQRVVYPVLDLNRRGRDLRAYVRALQQWLIDSLREMDVAAFATDDVGVWVETRQGKAKIAAIGIRVRRWVSFHGVALNVHPELARFGSIIPCGITDKGVTSLRALGVPLAMPEVDRVLLAQFNRHFG